MMRVDVVMGRGMGGHDEQAVQWPQDRVGDSDDEERWSIISGQSLNTERNTADERHDLLITGIRNN